MHNYKGANNYKISLYGWNVSTSDNVGYLFLDKAILEHLRKHHVRDINDLDSVNKYSNAIKIMMKDVINKASKVIEQTDSAVYKGDVKNLVTFAHGTNLDLDGSCDLTIFVFPIWVVIRALIHEKNKDVLPLLLKATIENDKNSINKINDAVICPSCKKPIYKYDFAELTKRAIKLQWHNYKICKFEEGLSDEYDTINRCSECDDLFLIKLEPFYEN